MSGGSEEKEHRFDRQCENCGRWYYANGNSFALHVANCDGEPPADDDGESEPTLTGAVNDGTGSDGGTEQGPTGPPAERDRAAGDGGDPLVDTDPGREQTVDSTKPLPCGHERVDMSKVSAGARVRCETCGDSWRLQR